MKRNRILIAISFIFGGLTLTSCDLGKEISDTINQNLFPNVWSFLAQVLATVVLFVCVIFLAIKPARKYLNKRKELLENEVKETHKNKEESEINRLESEKNIGASKEKAKKIVEDAKAQAKLEEKAIIDEANKEASKRIKDSEEIVNREKAKAVNEIKDAISEVAFSATTKILEREVNEKDNQKIIDDFVDEMKEDK